MAGSNQGNKTLLPIEEQFCIMADTAPVMIWISGVDKKCFYFNTGWLRFTGRDMEDETGEGWLEGIHEEDFDQCLHTYTNSFDAREEYKMEYRLRRHDGEYRWIVDHGVPRFDEKKQFVGYIGSCVDIHEIKESDERKDEFINAASHELKTPVTTMKVYVQMLQELLENSPDEEPPLYLRKVDYQITKLTKLINNLLDLTRIQSGSLQLDMEIFNFQDLIDETLESHNATINTHQLYITGKRDFEIYADRERLSQVLVNLLDNARKYSPHSDKISMNVQCNDGRAEVSVRDYGIGISSKDQKRIFERFFRTEDVNKKSFPGLGIGLFLSMQIIKKHKGLLEVQSEEGKGSTFTFTIPVK